MEKSKEFQGKTLDSAIQSACEYFDVPREKLEIEIINDAKAGIFGLVGAKKATILARKSVLASTTGSVFSSQQSERDAQAEYCCAPRGPSCGAHEQHREGLKTGDGGCSQETSSCMKKECKSSDGVGDVRKNRRAFVRGVSKRATFSVEKAPFRFSQEPVSSAKQKTSRDIAESARVAKPELEEKGMVEFQSSPFEGEMALPDENEAAFEGLPVVPLEQLDAEKLCTETQAAVQRIVSMIVQDAQYSVRIEDGRVNVSIESSEDSGLLIGREGQTLSSVQYLVSRIVSKAMGASISLQLDAGDYRERQDEKLREMARQLARRVHETGRPHSTRPLSSYHRRVVHMTLQDDAEIQTRSKGEGPLKRVILFRKSARPGAVENK